jgi:cytochrome c oxidase subunit II
MDSEFRLIPIQAAEGAASLDALTLFLVIVSGFFTVLIFLLIVYFALYYRQGRNVDRRGAVHESMTIEVGWSIVPFVLVMIMFGWGAVLFVRGSQAPAASRTVDVIAKQWMWRVHHPEGKREINTLHVPVGQTVKLRMISDDVIHSFFIPAFRNKMDVLPGRHTQMWFTPTRTGEYHLFCAEYCGTEHSLMRGTVVVMEPGEFAAWLRDSTEAPPETIGAQLFAQFRCDNCHHSDPGARAPPLGGVYGSEVPLQDGSTAIADEAYLRESILNPAAKIVAGYRNEMPTFAGQLGEEDVMHLIAYIKSLPAPDAAPANPASRAPEVSPRSAPPESENP